MRVTGARGGTWASSSRSSGDSTKPPRAPIVRWAWNRVGERSLSDPTTRAGLRGSERGLPFRGGDRLLEVEHVPVRILELAEPLAPFHLLGRKRELDAGAPHPFVFRLDVIRDECDARGPGLGFTAHEAQVNASSRATGSNFHPVAWVIGRPLNARVRVRLARADVGDVQSQDIPIPCNRLSRIGNDDRNRVDTEDGHRNRDRIRSWRYELECRASESVSAPRPRAHTFSRTTP